ncbi:dihydrofolate reductase [Nocardioides jishulii]|uniref:Dihydrofolate reductase n=1 Tax=Nocardioides jishulii TaxID=2575440 RepID=A0A4U2YMV7_9ACTN|nr:dihydrofolate reductase [Nocardioides jishulii]QCX27780.1 dihydrofolate reductase [Nocardioides jishulii]TKI62587.1 dihydrofolate reductase [Nocardioides jishulii]
MTGSSDAATPHVTLIAAYAHGRVIGDGPDIPWHSREDFGHFKATTLGHTLVMGRVTHESIGRPLPGRRTIVMTRDRDWRDEGVTVAHSLEEALDLAGDDEVFVAGGAQVYEAALPVADQQILTEVDIDVSGDAFYPEFDPAEWTEVRRISRPDLDPPLSWVWWTRR